MARLRIVELPVQHNGDEMTTPFAVIFDQVSDGSPLLRDLGRVNDAVRAWGARGALVTADTIELADELPVAEPFELVVEGGHLFGGDGHDDPLRCRRCGIERVEWVTRRDVPTCESVRRTKGFS
jgi:hypothetical protein